MKFTPKYSLPVAAKAIVFFAILLLATASTTDARGVGRVAYRKFARHAHPHKKVMTFASGYHGDCGCSH